MEQGKISKILEKESSKGKQFKSALIDGVWYNCFSEAINKILVEGETIKFEFESNGTFKNITKLLGNEASTEKVEEVVIQSLKPDKDLRITRLAVLNTSVEMHKLIMTEEQIGQTQNQVLLKSIKEVAEDLEMWVLR